MRSMRRASALLRNKLRCVPGTETSVTAASPAEAGVPRRLIISAARNACGPIVASMISAAPRDCAARTCSAGAVARGGASPSVNRHKARAARTWTTRFVCGVGAATRRLRVAPSLGTASRPPQAVPYSKGVPSWHAVVSRASPR
eukprot:scaffold52675_cov64-Phaeocystis_antarctica.AAC.2